MKWIILIFLKANDAALVLNAVMVKWLFWLNIHLLKMVHILLCVEDGIFNEVYSNGREWHGWYEKREMPSDIIGEWVDEED